MKSINWRTVAEFVGILALVGSLLFVGIQIKLDREIARSQVNMAALEARVTIEVAIAEHADVWMKASNLEELTNAEAVIVERLIRMSSFKAFFESLAASNVTGRTGSARFPESSPVIGGFSRELFENAGARRIWSAMADRHADFTQAIGVGNDQLQFDNAVRSQLAKLDEWQKAGAIK